MEISSCAFLFLVVFGGGGGLIAAVVFLPRLLKWYYRCLKANRWLSLTAPTTIIALVLVSRLAVMHTHVVPCGGTAQAHPNAPTRVVAMLDTCRER